MWVVQILTNHTLKDSRLHTFSLTWKHHLVPEGYSNQLITLIPSLSNKPQNLLPIWPKNLLIICIFIKIYLGNHKKISSIWMEVTPTTSQVGLGYSKITPLTMPPVASGDFFTVKPYTLILMFCRIRLSEKDRPSPGPVSHLQGPLSPGERGIHLFHGQ